jgi:hypothetical protein
VLDLVLFKRSLSNDQQPELHRDRFRLNPGGGYGASALLLQPADRGQGAACSLQLGLCALVAGQVLTGISALALIDSRWTFRSVLAVQLLLGRMAPVGLVLLACR